MAKRKHFHLPKSLKIYLRRKKAQIRKEIFLPQQQKEAILNLYKEILQKLKTKSYEDQRNI